MKIHQLNVTGNKNRKRRGRGISAGQGKTAGRGTKGQNSRSGGGVRRGFEGGQNPLMKRLPKVRGFSSYAKKYSVVYTHQLNRFKAGTKVDAQLLAKNRLITSHSKPVKLIKSGELNKALKVTVDRVSQGAQAAVEKAGGEVVIGTSRKTTNAQ